MKRYFKTEVPETQNYYPERAIFLDSFIDSNKKFIIAKYSKEDLISFIKKKYRFYRK